MNQPDYQDVPKEFPPDWASAYGQDNKGYWLENDVYKQLLCFRWIPKGQFTMGSDKNEKGRYENEDQHQVILSRGFWLAETTVTQALWLAVMGKNPSDFQEDDTANFPVEQVSWDDAQKFIAKLNQHQPGLTFRLPSEAEWEYACRAGTKTPFNFEGELSVDKVNYRGTWGDYGSRGKGAKEATVEVKNYAANAWELYEMHGNVWEWCADEYQHGLGNETTIDPRGVGVSSGRVLRGGSWLYFGRYARSAYRLWAGPDDRGNYIGFRLALVHKFQPEK
ncbi:MAG: SUMF1/EgtB/PvdO family nonheme iron enzyme [Methyloprofundus sp.]|nr:SUMF1/EgtB/PvdO family nonheme iron enzyme [Methyloprofundus sp.]